MTSFNPVVSCFPDAKVKPSFKLAFLYILFFYTFYVSIVWGSQPRLWILALLNAKPGEFTALLAIVCSSWTTINMATSGRTPCTPLGNGREYVEAANRMASRSLAHCMRKARVNVMFTALFLPYGFHSARRVCSGFASYCSWWKRWEERGLSNSRPCRCFAFTHG